MRRSALIALLIVLVVTVVLLVLVSRAVAPDAAASAATQTAWAEINDRVYVTALPALDTPTP
jgi:preprotein translocase subunit SecG